MTSANRLAAFMDQYDLYDRAVISISDRADQGMNLLLELGHCDDPQRDREDISYRLSLDFAPGDLVVSEGPVHPPFHPFWGEIVDHGMQDDALSILIEWYPIDRGTARWTSLRILDAPRRIEETQVPLDGSDGVSNGDDPDRR